MDERLYYQSKDEMKAAFRGCIFGDDPDEVRGFLKSIEDGDFDGGDWSFRGVKSAKYKLLASLQRKWIEQGLDNAGLQYHELVREFVDAARRLQARYDDRVPAELKEVEPWNELGLLSYLEHYGCPTPLLNFTADIRVALFFAIQPPSHKEKSALDEYSTIYTFHDDVMTVTNAGLLAQWRKHSEARFNDSRRAVASFHVMTLAPVLIHKQGWYDQHCGAGSIPFYNNARIQAQKGLFMSNSTKDTPVIEAIHDFVAKDIQDPQTLASIRTYVNCVNIHRRFVPLIEEWLRRNAPFCTPQRLLPKQPEHDGVQMLFDEVVAQIRTRGSHVTTWERT